ncbi:PREDICTED: neuroligin-1-like isoform X1 [Cyprinodon variegatus]|uniref:Liver carboxylesterase 2-like n=1 Tax=Cyprinodon variegatus TaxID=28743 RepID=A0A3Q2CHP4_CYPVA|nr:PREDICTED: neuroligin-1-like isoform X1 [Cyprinodon variegatus]
MLLIPTMRFHRYFLVSALFLSAAADPQAPEVQTKLGRLRGQYVSVKGKETGVHAFLGIPFAKPPLGPTLRLAAPQPTEGWSGLRDATKQPKICIQDMEVVNSLIEQLSGMMVDIPDASEDCLYLNIYTPANRAPDAKLPVMVWIHGGGFALGSASMFDGSALSSYQDVVVVLIQYRLGLLGFFSTGDEHIPGNLGLLDQVQALRWVKEHIQNFGGNPDLVTIFGESAGGASVSLLLLSPLANGLFHRAIAESGTAALDALVGKDPVPVMQAVANASGCSFESTEQIAKCIRNLDIDTILALGKDRNLGCTVNIDGHFLTKPVPELYQNHELLNVPFMTGINNHEGGFMLASHFGSPNFTEGMDKESIGELLLMFFPLPEAAPIRDLIIKEYVGSGEDRIRNRDGFTELLGDFLFTFPAIKSVNAHRDAGAPVYLYEYHHAPMFLQKKRPSFVKCDHGDDMFTVMGYCFTTTHVKLADPCPKEEEEFSRIMMSYWGNFARTGSPNGEGLVNWPKYEADEKYLSIDLKNQASAQFLKKDRFIFVTETLPEKIRKFEENRVHAPEVQTKLGRLRGQYVSVKGKEMGVHAFLGIPFAKPPLGPTLRLAAPQPPEGWSGLRDATKQPKICIQDMDMVNRLVEQLSGMMVDIPDASEDCLYLNIYTPANRAPDAKLPVMVWIHGGGFVLGSASMFDGSALAAYQDVVVVLIQYRLGLLGFISTGDEHIPGNLALLDQVQSLRWVKEHIQNFGGNPDLVTIFGESAGGVSVSLLLLSPLSDGLFHHAIAESGTAAMDVLVGHDPVPMMKAAANASGCNLESTEQIAKCIRNLDIETILALGKDQNLRFPVSVDGHFLTRPVPELLQKHELLTVPFMTGINNHEGGFSLAQHFAPPNWTEGIDRESIGNMLLTFFPLPEAAPIRELIVNEYVGSGEDRIRNRDGFTEILGDFFFTFPALKVVNAHRDAGAAVYLYEYHHAPTFLQKKRPSFVKCDHADDIFTVLGYCFTTTHVKLADPCPKEEEEFSKIMMSYWGNFARTGSPNGEGVVNWPKYGAEEKYLSLDLKKQVSAQFLKKNRFDFVTQTLPQKIKKLEENTEHSEL